MAGVDDNSDDDVVAVCCVGDGEEGKEEGEGEREKDWRGCIDFFLSFVFILFKNFEGSRKKEGNESPLVVCLGPKSIVTQAHEP